MDLKGRVIYFCKADQSHVSPQDTRPLTTHLIMPALPAPAPVLNISSTWLLGKARVEPDLLAEPLDFISSYSRAEVEGKE